MSVGHPTAAPAVGAQAVDAPAGSIWACHPAAEGFVVDALDRARRANEVIGRLAGELEGATATKLIDWVDHLGVASDPATVTELGWREDGATGLWRHPAARLPALILTASATEHVALKADDLDACARALDADTAPVGRVAGTLRTVSIRRSGGVELRGVERRSYAAGVDAPADLGRDLDAAAVVAARARWAVRRLDEDDAASLADAIDAAHTMVDAVGRDRAAAFVFEQERARWQARCAAAAGTHAVQQRFGLGFANRDHHTLRSSRANFAGLLACLRVLGFEGREQFHAGEEAGWGALVLEHPGTGEVVFADVDLEPAEADADLARGLEPRPLGPVGMWCATHGDSFLQAGLHHLAALYDFDHYRLAPAAPPLQDPFSDLEHLRQAFTQPEAWEVDPARAAHLLADADLPAAAAARVRSGRVPGSHLEIIERRHGFKGFNQRSVSRTIALNDLRT